MRACVQVHARACCLLWFSGMWQFGNSLWAGFFFFSSKRATASCAAAQVSHVVLNSTPTKFGKIQPPLPTKAPLCIPLYRILFLFPFLSVFYSHHIPLCISIDSFLTYLAARGSPGLLLIHAHCLNKEVRVHTISGRICLAATACNKICSFTWIIALIPIARRYDCGTKVAP